MRRLLALSIGFCGLSAAAAGSWNEKIDVAWKAFTAPHSESLIKERDAKAIQHGEHTLRFHERRFGVKPQSGHALFISMHGGGGGPARMNDQQWNNQIRLYEPKEGIVVAPRAPGNTWDLWHKSHIDPLFDRLIFSYIADGLVNPNRVYLMGYSAGGDGTFQLAPRMADRFAAASMMAGHPNETQPDGLRNLPFSIWMGGKDSAYKRNQIAAEWKDKLAAKQKADPEGYTHLVTIYPHSGHWMNGRDRAALPWMTQYTRNPWPKKIVWLQDDVTHSRFYWLAAPADQVTKGDRITAEVDGQTIRIDSSASTTKTLQLYLSDALLDLDQAITVTRNGKTAFQGTVPRDPKAIATSFQTRPDPKQAATAILTLTPGT